MVLVSAITNPLDPTRRPVTCQMLSGLPVQHYIDAMLPVVRDDYDIAIGIDGHLVDWTPETLVNDGQSLSIVVVPQGSGGGGKSIMKMVALIGLTMAAGWVGGGVAGMMAGEGFSTGAFWGLSTYSGANWAMGLAASGGIMLAGNLLMNAVLPIQTARATNYNGQSATYSWDVAANPVLEGAALPILFGTHRITPPRIGIYPEGSGTNQTLNILLAVAGHEIDSITDITINETDIANYTECTYDADHLGTNNQTVIQAFDDTRTVVAVDPAALLSTTAVTKTTLGNAFTRIAFGLSFPFGLYDAQNQDIKTASVKLEISYSVHGSGVWKTMDFITDEPAYVAIDHWSAGYSLPVSDDTGNITGETWVEVEQGSTNPGDHVEGDVYTGDNWATTQYSGQDFKPIVYWKWVDDSVKYVAQSGTTLPYIIISASNTNPLRYIFYTPRLDSTNIYDLRLKLYEDPYEGNSLVVDDCYWEYYDEILEDDFIYPNTALLAIRSIASNRLSGSVPRVSCVASRSKVWVYDPVGAQYVQKNATNHAWASYEILHGARRLVDINAAGYDPANSATWTYTFIQTGAVAHERIMYDDFSEWADWIDLEETGTYGEKKQYTLNIYLDTTLNVRKALDLIGLGGRGLAVQQGSYWTCVVDKPEDTPVQRFGFNMATIKRDSFTEEWTPIDQRANCIEATYYDASDDWRPKTIEMYQVGFDEMVDEVKKTTLDLRGFTDFEQAQYFLRYQLNLNRYITLTASWDADLSAIACTRSQIIEVQHDVPQYGYGGRLEADCTTTTLYLDREVTIETGSTYHVIIYHADDDSREEVAVSTGAGVVTTLTVAELTKAPEQYSLWFFGKINQVCKLMRVLSISLDGEFRRNIKAIEHVNEVFNDAAEIPTPSSGSDLPRQMFPPPLDHAELDLTWKLNAATKTWEPFVRAGAIYNPAIDYLNIAIPISNARAWVHIEDGDTTSQVITAPFEGIYDWNGSIVDMLAAEWVGKTIYFSCALVNSQGMVGPKTAVASLYVDTSFTPAPTTSNIEISAYDYTNCGPNGYTAYFNWVPYGWRLNVDKYEPILDWNSGSNYYVFAKYCIVIAYVENQYDIPTVDQMMHVETADIGNIFDDSGSMITDADALDKICRNACSSYLQAQYSEKWLALTVFPVMKNGTHGVIDFSQADYGLDWEYIQVRYPGGTNNNVTDNQITNAELVYTMQPGSVFLNEMNWDYALESPYIDGFAIIFRAQPYWWSWVLSGSISSSTTAFSTIASALDLSSGGGLDAAQDFADRYAEWYAGGVPCFYMMIADATHYEIIRVNTQTLAVDRGAEGSVSRTWSAGAVISYSPCEYIDTIAGIADTKQRNYVFNPPIEINFALHCTIAAVKYIAESPGYARSHYAYWDFVRAR